MLYKDFDVYFGLTIGSLIFQDNGIVLRSVASNGSAVCFIYEKTDEKEPLSKLTSRGKPSIENLLAESSNNQLLAKFQGLWDNDSDSKIVYYHRNCKHEIFNAAKTSSRK